MLKQVQVLFIFSISLCLFSDIAFGHQADSILILEKSLAEKLPDTVRLKNLIRLSEICMADKNTISKGEVYISKALEFTREKNFPVPYRLQWLNAKLLRSHDMVKKAVDEMETVISYLEEKKNFTVAGEARNYLASLLFFAGQFNESISLYQQNIALAREKQLKTIVPNAYLGIANVYAQTQNAVERKNHLLLFLEEAKKENNAALIAQACFRVGVQLMFVDSNLQTVMPYLQESLKINKSIGDSLSALTVLNMIG